MRVLSLFSGIGAFDLGLERAGMTTTAFCEIDLFCRRVLARHWPEVPCYDDVRTLTADRLRADGIAVDVICGGFPCTDISIAGSGAGITGPQSGLWSEFARLIGEIRPRYALIENVAALAVRGLDRVLCDLAALGFDAEWHCIPAAAVGAPHIRDRVWIVAYPQRADTHLERSHRADLHEQAAAAEFRDQQVSDAGSLGEDVADATSCGCEGVGGSWQERVAECSAHVTDACGPRLAIGPGTLREWSHAATTGSGWWATEPDVGRVANGIAHRVDRLRSLGNSLVPQIPELIGRAILEREAARERLAA